METDGCTSGVGRRFGSSTTSDAVWHAHTIYARRNPPVCVDTVRCRDSERRPASEHENRRQHNAQQCVVNALRTVCVAARRAPHATRRRVDGLRCRHWCSTHRRQDGFVCARVCRAKRSHLTALSLSVFAFVACCARRCSGDQAQKVYEIYSMCEPRPSELLQNPRRYFIKEGPVILWNEREKKKKDRWIFLFNDVRALIATRCAPRAVADGCRGGCAARQAFVRFVVVLTHTRCGRAVCVALVLRRLSVCLSVRR